MAESPELAVEMVQRFEPLLKLDIERERLRLAMSCCIFTPNVIKNGFGGVDEQRLKHSIAQIAAAYALPRVPTTAEMFDSSYLPPAEDRMIR
jgi:NitT/TauT family transport system substrate-binding protein